MSMMICQKCGDQLIDTDDHPELWVTLLGHKDKYGQPVVECWCFNCHERHAEEIDDNA